MRGIYRINEELERNGTNGLEGKERRGKVKEVKRLGWEMVQ